MEVLRYLVLALALSTASCSIIAATRAPSLEQGEDACSNFVDDDLDGLLDCDDLECDGLCPEEALGACGDFRDNDGDGVTDGADARCWHVVPPDAKRCATVLGSRVEPSIERSALAWRGLADLVPDPRDPTRSVFAPIDDDFRISPVASSTGALDGLRLTATVRMQAAIDTSIALIPAGEIGDASTSAVFTRYVRLTLGNEIFLATEGSETERLLAPPELRSPTWIDVEITITGRTINTALTIEDGSVAHLATLELPASFVDPMAIDVLVQADLAVTADAPMLASLVIERPSLPACGRDELVPEMRAEGFNLVLATARGGPGGTMRCAITSYSGVGLSYVASDEDPDDGDWHESPDWIAPSELAGAAFAWDERRGAFVGIAARGSDILGGLSPTSFDRIESADCVTWTLVPSELPAVASGVVRAGRGMQYTIASDGRHTLRILAGGGGEVGLFELVSPNGEPGSFVSAGGLQPAGPEARALVMQGAQLSIESIGARDLVLFATTDQGLVVLTPRGVSGRFVELPEPLLGLSEVDGTFDRGRIFGPPRLLTSLDPAVVRLFYGGTSFGNCYGCLTSGSALLTIGGE